MNRVSGKTAFVTGASSGIGKAAALALIKAGYRVIGTSRKAAPGEIRDGIRVSVIEPWATKTSIETNSPQGDRPVAVYAQALAKYRTAFDAAMAGGDTAEEVAATIVAAAQDRVPRLRYPSGKAARQTSFARRFLPRSFFDRTLRKQFGFAKYTRN